LYSCAITLAELASAIESNEWEIHKRTVIHIDKKDFRHDCHEARAKVIAEVASCWDQVMQVAKFIEMKIDEPTTQRLLDSIRCCRMDGYDALMLDAMTKRGVFNIITDDGDFATVPDITVFTANAHVLHLAKREGRLKRRE